MLLIVTSILLLQWFKKLLYTSACNLQHQKAMQGYSSGQVAWPHSRYNKNTLWNCSKLYSFFVVCTVYYIAFRRFTNKQWCKLFSAYSLKHFINIWKSVKIFKKLYKYFVYTKKYIYLNRVQIVKIYTRPIVYIIL